MATRNMEELQRQTTHVYVARKKCGCMVAAVSDMPTFERETAKDVADFIRDGLAIERMTMAEYKGASGAMGCKCGPQQGSL